VKFQLAAAVSGRRPSSRGRHTNGIPCCRAETDRIVSAVRSRHALPVSDATATTDWSLHYQHLQRASCRAYPLWSRSTFATYRRVSGSMGWTRAHRDTSSLPSPHRERRRYRFRRCRSLPHARSLQRIRKARRQKLAPTELSALRVSWHDSWACQRTFPCRWIRCAAEQDACNAAKCKRSIRFAFDARCIPEATERRLAAPWARRGHRSDLVYGVQSATDAKRLPIPAREIDLRTLPYRAASPGWLKSRRGRAFHPQPQSYWLSGHAKSASGR